MQVDLPTKGEFSGAATPETRIIQHLDREVDRDTVMYRKLYLKFTSLTIFFFSN